MDGHQETADFEVLADDFEDQQAALAMMNEDVK